MQRAWVDHVNRDMFNLSKYSHLLPSPIQETEVKTELDTEFSECCLVDNNHVAISDYSTLSIWNIVSLEMVRIIDTSITHITALGNTYIVGTSTISGQLFVLNWRTGETVNRIKGAQTFQGATLKSFGECYVMIICPAEYGEIIIRNVLTNDGKTYTALFKDLTCAEMLPNLQIATGHVSSIQITDVDSRDVQFVGITGTPHRILAIKNLDEHQIACLCTCSTEPNRIDIWNHKKQELVHQLVLYEYYTPCMSVSYPYILYAPMEDFPKLTLYNYITKKRVFSLEGLNGEELQHDFIVSKEHGLIFNIASDGWLVSQQLFKPNSNFGHKCKQALTLIDIKFIFT